MKVAGASRLLAILLLAPFAVSAESARSLVAKGNHAYDRGDYPEALAIYNAAGDAAPDSAEIWFNKGNALYRQGEYRKAIDAYEQAALQSRDASLEARSKFNQGNASFRAGTQLAPSNPGQALAEMERGVHFYRDALRADPDYQEARQNIEIARRAIEELRRRMQDQPHNQQQDSRAKPEQEAGQQPKQNQGQEQDSGQKNNPPASPPPAPGEQPQPQPAKPSAEQDGERQQPAPGEEARDILNEERENRRARRLQAVVAVRPVEKDW
jgi:Ca-activated chloride channel family protein